MVKSPVVFFAFLLLGAAEIGAAFYAASGGAPLALSLAPRGGAPIVQNGEPRIELERNPAARSGEPSAGSEPGPARDGARAAHSENDASSAAANSAPAAAAPADAGADLRLCPQMDVSNAPAADGEGRVLGYAPRVSPADGVELILPVRKSCLSSGYGDRDGKLHKGVDFQSRPAEMVTAAGDGVILEALFRDDYGNMVLIDHGQGIYTRYAHLESFAPGIAEGAAVTAETPLGRMGDSAGYSVPIHLHYEILAGDYDTPQASFGLEPLDPFALPAA
ncbi:MAG: hypothetical protein Tsb0010_05990 [Parvularculaceae bacterium]